MYRREQDFVQGPSRSRFLWSQMFSWTVCARLLWAHMYWGNGCLCGDASLLWGLLGRGGAQVVLSRARLGHLKQSSLTGNPDIHLSRGSLDQGSREHRCGVVIVARVGSLLWGVWDLVGWGMGCAFQDDGKESSVLQHATQTLTSPEAV